MRNKFFQFSFSTSINGSTLVALTCFRGFCCIWMKARFSDRCIGFCLISFFLTNNSLLFFPCLIKLILLLKVFGLAGPRRGLIAGAAGAVGGAAIKLSGDWLYGSGRSSWISYRRVIRETSKRRVLEIKKPSFAPQGADAPTRVQPRQVFYLFGGPKTTADTTTTKEIDLTTRPPNSK
jgi:hypothetical protein